jgi:NADH-quinone oxidoreductase subunit J
MNIAFTILALLASISALLATRLRNLVYAVLSLMLFFSALAGLFFLLLAEFIGAVQILVYVGAVGILLLFAIMLTRHVTGSAKERIDARGWAWAIPAAGAVLLGVLMPAILHTPLPSRPYSGNFDPSVLRLGEALMSPYAATLEVMALLLTVALIAAVAVAMPPEKQESRKISRNPAP